MNDYEVKAHWDAEAGVWWAESDDVPGLVAEAPTPEAMIIELRKLVPELLIENGVLPAGSSFKLRILLDEIEDLCVA